MGAMMMNVAANMLGVSNAATPLGLKAMTRLNELNRTPGVATNAMCTFLALNTSSVQLVPVTAINLLAINGSHNPTAILASTLVSTSLACVAALTIVYILERLNRGPLGSGLDLGAARAAVSGHASSLGGRGGSWCLSLDCAVARLFFALSLTSSVRIGR
jgi:spore maturation protein SpmA